MDNFPSNLACLVVGDLWSGEPSWQSDQSDQSDKQKSIRSRQTNIMSSLAEADDILWQGEKTDWNHPLLLTANMHHKGHLVSVTHSDDDSWGSLLTFVRTRRLSISIAGHNKGGNIEWYSIEWKIVILELFYKIIINILQKYFDWSECNQI